MWGGQSAQIVLFVAVVDNNVGWSDGGARKDSSIIEHLIQK